MIIPSFMSFLILNFMILTFAIKLAKLPDDGPGLVPIARSERAPQITRERVPFISHSHPPAWTRQWMSTSNAMASL